MLNNAIRKYESKAHFKFFFPLVYVHKIFSSQYALKSFYWCLSRVLITLRFFIYIFFVSAQLMNSYAYFDFVLTVLIKFLKKTTNQLTIDETSDSRIDGGWQQYEWTNVGGSKG